MTRAKAAKAKKKAAKVRHQPRKNCPTPEKRSYWNATAIPTALHRASVSGLPMRIYKCPCGRYHLTSKPERKEDT